MLLHLQKPRSLNNVMNTPILSFLLLCLLSPALTMAVEVKPPALPTNPPSTNSLASNALAQATPLASPSVATTSSVIPSSTALTNSASPAPDTVLQPRELAEIHSTMLLPKDWTLIPGKLLQGDVLIATRDKITNSTDSWNTGLSMTLDRNGAKDSGQKASIYALGLAREAHDKAAEDATPIKESQSGPFHEIRFDFSVAGDQPLLITEVLRANDNTGALAVILWQSPKEEAAKLHDLKEQILAGIKLDPNQ